MVNDLPQHLIKGNLLTLYHGSKTGIEGDIKPDSRVRCDFGKGFYMATQIQEALTLICSNSETVLYVVALDLTGLKVVTIPSDIDWAMLVAYYRGRLNHVKGTQLYEKYSTMLLGCDIVVGSIVSDRLFLALDRFFEGIITDKGLIESLSALQQGKQYVAISQKACNQIKIVRKEKLPLLVRLCIEDISEANRQYGISTATDICRNYRRDGRFFDEILKESR
ncbi:MAG: DUF3990 domain-containing protein [Christensenellaceae bacterium]|nr:DUF3990 domain-containing protein [Christensenellaceae bacterium]